MIIYTAANYTSETLKTKVTCDAWPQLNSHQPQQLMHLSASDWMMRVQSLSWVKLPFGSSLTRALPFPGQSTICLWNENSSPLLMTWKWHWNLLICSSLGESRHIAKIGPLLSHHLSTKLSTVALSQSITNVVFSLLCSASQNLYGMTNLILGVWAL